MEGEVGHTFSNGMIRRPSVASDSASGSEGGGRDTALGYGVLSCTLEEVKGKHKGVLKLASKFTSC